MRRLLAAALGTGLLLCLTPPAGAADGDPATGYWARTRTGLPVPVEPPDPVPEGGTWVAADPTGPVAVSALRTELVTGLVAVELRLAVADVLGTPAVQACPSPDRWAPEQGGRLEAAPPADCAAPLAAEVEGDVLVVPLPPGLAGVNVLLRPAPGSAFSLTMERATAASVVTAPAPSTAVPLPADLPPPGPSTLPPGFDAGFAAPLDLPDAGFLAAPLLASAPVLPGSTSSLPAPAPQTAPPPLAAPVAVARPVVPDGRTASLLAAAVLVLVGAQAVRLAQRPAVAPRALGGSARRSGSVLVVPAPPTRGVGRFRTARATPPVRI